MKLFAGLLPNLVPAGLSSLGRTPGTSTERTAIWICWSSSRLWRIDVMIRLQHRLRGLGIPVDVLVFSERQVAEWGDVRGTVLYPALREGIGLYEAA